MAKPGLLLLLVLLLSLGAPLSINSRPPQEITALETDDRLNILFHRYPVSWVRQSLFPEVTLKSKMLLLNISSVNARFFGIDRNYILPFTSDNSPWFYNILIKETSGLVTSKTSNMYEIGYSVTDRTRVSLISELTADKSFIDLGARVRAGIGYHNLMITYRQVDYLFNEKHPSESYYDIFPERVDLSWLFDSYPHTLLLETSQVNLTRFVDVGVPDVPRVVQRDEDKYHAFYQFTMEQAVVGIDSTYQHYFESRQSVQESVNEEVSISTMVPFLNLPLDRSLSLHNMIDITTIGYRQRNGPDNTYTYTGFLSVLSQELSQGVVLQYGYAIMAARNRNEIDEKIVINLEFRSPELGTLRLINSWNPEPAADGLFLWNGSGGQYMVFF